MFDGFSHFISFSAKDQQTARDLTGCYDGLVVPGTVASFLADGTKGFVLTLSATSAAPPYVVDPRFPLFQQPLSDPRRSHRALADVLGAPFLVQPERPISPDAYTDELIELITDNWLRFNSGFTDIALTKFNKYAERLNENIIPANRKGPAWILPPYLTTLAGDPRWTRLSGRFWQCAQDRCELPGSLVRVVAVDTADLLEEQLLSCPDDRLVIWVNNLDEVLAEPDTQGDLVTYGRAIQEARARGKKTFALYGGFFSVLLGMFGLSGASHGIGYSEHRAWEELPQTGQPPARYYLIKAHRYVSMDLALFLWEQDRSLVACDCAECQSDTPALLDYSALMKHSVRCRAAEVKHWSHVSPDQAVNELSLAAEMFEDVIADLQIPPNLRRSAERCPSSLRVWAAAVGAISQTGT
jgi:hypothetical protein